jgi:hypothetical protein
VNRGQLAEFGTLTAVGVAEKAAELCPDVAQALFRARLPLGNLVVSPHDTRAIALTLLRRDEVRLELLDAALDRLAATAPPIKKNVIEACAQVVAADGLIHEREAELLRAIAETLDCPIPPFVLSAEPGE